MQPLVGLIMGSKSDWPTLEHAANMLDRLGVPYETRVVSAHRTEFLWEGRRIVTQLGGTLNSIQIVPRAD